MKNKMKCINCKKDKDISNFKVESSGRVCKGCKDCALKRKQRRITCMFEGCKSLSQYQGFCEPHSTKEPVLCKVEGCNNIRVSKDVCTKHGAPKYKCIVEGCENYQKKGGVCITHGAPSRKSYCIVPDCTRQQVSDKLCVTHGGIRTIYYCKIPECKNNVYRKRLCVKHGAPVENCREPGCEKHIINSGVCMEHGAIVKTCTVEECKSYRVGGGKCQFHGGVITKCIHDKYKQQCNICNPLSYLAHLVRGRIRDALQRNKELSSQKYLCCDIETFKIHIENKFEENMSWSNHGLWELDHYVPIKFRRIKGIDPTLEEVIDRLHYENVQPLWKKDNLKKRNLYIR